MHLFLLIYNRSVSTFCIKELQAKFINLSTSLILVIKLRTCDRPLVHVYNHTFNQSTVYTRHALTILIVGVFIFNKNN